MAEPGKTATKDIAALLSATDADGQADPLGYEAQRLILQNQEQGSIQADRLVAALQVSPAFHSYGLERPSSRSMLPDALHGDASIGQGCELTGRGYSFEVLRARMLHDRKARKGGSVAETILVDNHGPALPEFFVKKMTAPVTRKKKVQCVVEYGPFIQTLCRQLEEECFEYTPP